MTAERSQRRLSAVTDRRYRIPSALSAILRGQEV
jgi:hypothetical protein